MRKNRSLHSEAFVLVFQAMKNVTLMILTVAIMAGCGGSSGAKLPAIDPVSIGMPVVSELGEKLGDVTSFSWTNPDGTKETFGVSDKKARIVVMWRYGCSACIEEIQTIQNFTDEYKEIPFITVCLNSEDTLNSVISVLENLNLTTPIVLDPTMDLAKAWGTTTPPETFLIDGQGKVQKRKKATISTDILFEFIEEAERMK